MNATERMVGAHTRSAARSRWGALTDWRNWSLPVKLGAVMLVPTVLAIVLGVVVIRGQVATAAGYTGSDQRTSLAERVRAVVTQVQLERVFEANSRVPGNVVTERLQRQQAAKVDAAVDAARGAFSSGNDLDETADSAWAAVNRQLDRLDSIRSTARSPALVPATVAGYYTDVLNSLLNLERTLLSQVGDAELAGMATATYDLDAAREEVSMQQATVLVGLARNELLPDETERLRNSSVRYSNLLDDFRSVAGLAQVKLFDQTFSGSQVDRRPTLLGDVLSRQGAAGMPEAAAGAPAARNPVGVPPGPWNLASRTTTQKLTAAADDIGTQLRERASSLQSGASDQAGVTAVLLFLTLLAAAAIVIVMARQLLGSVRTLHRTARQLAEHELPEAVGEIRAGRTVSTEIEPVPVQTVEEIGQLARAFDAVHSEARKLAVEQASMRTDYGSVFINLSRRSQSLVQRQLRLIERLERDEEDPDQLSTLFQLDHLATRMRRNNENLMVLSGSDSGRSGGQQPTALVDLLRAGVSEIEHYQRVEVQPPPNAQIVGYASGDLVRLVAELLDNATAFSAPETQVSVSTSLSADGSLVVDIIDSGIGMLSTELDAANRVLATSGEADIPPSRRMGLFVVNRLAERHQIMVRLHGGDGIDGIRACVTIPGNLIVSVDEPSGGLEHTSPQPDGFAEPSVVGPTMPAAAAPFGSADGSDATGYWQQSHYPEYSVTEYPVADQPVAQTPVVHGAEPVTRSRQWPGTASDPDVVREQPTESYPLVPRQERAASSAAQEHANGFAEPPGASSPADGLFTPATAASTSAEPEPPQDDPEFTPIFDEMISAWFVPQAARSRQPRPPQPRAESNGHRANGFHSTNGANGFAGSNGAHNGNGSRPEPSGSHGRNGSVEPVTTKGRDGWAEEHDADEQWRFAADQGWETSKAVSESKPDRFTDAGLPQRTPKARLVPGSVTGAAEEHEQGLPAPRNADNVRDRLSSFQRGIEGGRSPAEQPQAAAAEDMSTDMWTATTEQEPDQEPGQGPESGQEPQPGNDSYADVDLDTWLDNDREDTDDPELRSEVLRSDVLSSEVLSSDAPESDVQDQSSESAEPRWKFAADDGWRTAEAVSNSAPDGLTGAGLPRRTPRARLVPGSAEPAESRQGNAERDPENVRNRLGSFQRGIKDGRHSVHGPAQDTLEYGDTWEKE